MKKRIFAMILALCMLITLLPVQTVLAEGDDAVAQTADTAIQFKDGTPTTFYVGDTYTFEVVRGDGSAAPTDISWNLENEPDVLVADYLDDPVENTLEIIFMAIGTATLTATDADTGETASITLTVEGRAGDPGEVPEDAVVLQTGMNSVTVPGSSSVKCVFAPYADGFYDTYVFFVEDGNENWNFMFENEGQTTVAYRTVNANGYAAWLYGGSSYEFLLFNTSQEEVVFPLQVERQTEPTELKIVGAKDTYYLGETVRLQALPVQSTSVCDFVSWSCENCWFTRDENDGTIADVTFDEQGTAVVEATYYGEETEVTTSITIEVIHDENSPMIGVLIDGGESTFTIHDDDVTLEEISGYSFNARKGGTIADAGYVIEGPTFWDPDREFLGWQPATHGEEGYENIPGSALLTTEQLMAYTLPTDLLDIVFRAVWEGEYSDYYSMVQLDAWDGMMEIIFRREDSEDEVVEDSGFTFDGREGGSLAEEYGRYGTAILMDRDPWHEEYAFEGWLLCRWTEEGQEVLSETLYTFDDIFNTPLGEDDVVYCAKWDGIPIEDYEFTYGDGGDYDVPEDTEEIPVVLDQKYSLTAGQEAYFTFAVPESGHYVLCGEFPGWNLDLYSTEGNIWAREESGKCAVYLEKDSVFRFCMIPDADGIFWMEKGPVVTKLEVVSQDTSKVFQKSEDVTPEALMRGMKVKVTYADNTSQTYELESYNTSVGLYPLELRYDLESVTGDTAVITMRCGDVETTYTVKVRDGVVTKMEIIPEQLQVVENTMGSPEFENGYWYNMEEIVYQKAQYRFTWSNGSTETLKLSPLDIYYYGIPVDFSESYSQGENPWTVGNTYSLEARYGELRAPVSVQIVESPVEKVEVLEHVRLALAEPYFKKVSDTRWALDLFEPCGLKFRVTEKNGTATDYTFEDLEVRNDNYYAGEYPVVFDLATEVDLGNITGPCEIPLILNVGGKQADLKFCIVEQTAPSNEVTVSPSVIEEALQGGGEEIILDVTTENTDETGTNVVHLPTTGMETVAQADVDVTIKLDSATVTMDAAAVEVITGQANGDTISLSIREIPETSLGEAQKAALAGQKVGLVVDALLTSGGEAISNFGDGKVTISLPFTLPAGVAAEDVAVWYLSDDGELQKMPTTYANGVLTFTTGHFSQYVALCGAQDAIAITPMYRLYNPNSGEHFYTGSVEERDGLVALGWQLEGVAWNAPVDEGAPVYRTYNPNSGDHHYTMSWEEVENLVAVGWKYEGIAWNSAAAEGNVGQFRLYNPNADCGSHHYTSSVEERDYLVSLGWIFEGIGWYGIA